MADIPIERKEHRSVWPWVIGIIVLLIILWLLFGRNRGATTTTVGPDTTMTAPATTPTAPTTTTAPGTGTTTTPGTAQTTPTGTGRP